MPAIITSIVQYMLFAGAPAAVGCLGWWLSGKFRGLELAYISALAAHERDDERRHVENLGRFSEINVRLARIRDSAGAHQKER